MIRLDRVRKRFGAHEVLRGVSLSVRAGSTLALLGPSGVGKSVLLKTVIGLLEQNAPAQAFYEAGQYAQCAEAFAGLLGSERSSTLSPRTKEQASVYRAACLIALGKTAGEVESSTAMYVKTARILLGTYALGGPNFLTPEHVSRIYTRPDEKYREKQIGVA